MAAQNEPTKPAPTDTGTIIAVGIIGLIILANVFSYLSWTPSSEEKRTLDTTASLCRLRVLCNDYPGARDVCATAGNFEKCMAIKLGSRDDYQDATRLCTNSGEFAVDPEKTPSVWACWDAKLKGAL
jgi:hypothetical protein